MDQPAAKQIAETVIALSAPEGVFGWLRERYEAFDERDTAGAHDRYRELDLELFSRGDPLINLGLAAYGTTTSILAELFHSDHRPFVRQGFRLAILSNRVAGFDMAFPDSLMPEDTTASTWLSSLTDAEALALLNNVALYHRGRFLETLLLSKDLANEFGEDRLEVLVTKIIDMQRERLWSGHQNTSLNSVLWQLAATLPTTRRWAANMRQVFDGTLSQPAHFPEASLVATRWCPDGEDLWWTEEVNASGYLDEYQVIRRGLALVALRSAPDRSSAFLRSRDLAERCAAYALSPLSSEEIRLAHARDRLFAAREMIYNDFVWPDEAVRETLHDACQDLRQNDPTEEHVGLLGAFHFRYNELEERHPEWFADPSGADQLH